MNKKEGSSSPDHYSANRKRKEPMSRPLTYQIDPAKEPLIHPLLESAGYSFASAPHAFWTASDGETTFIFYRTGNPTDFRTNCLFPGIEIRKESPYEHRHPQSKPIR